MKGAGLGDLRSEDRQRLRQLIQDLALAESEKEEAVGRLKRERKDHDQQVSVLRARQAALVKDKGNIRTLYNLDIFSNLCMLIFLAVL